ncbi:MAG: serine/threonine-protein kinase [Polyangiaceae bacterium]
MSTEREQPSGAPMTASGSPAVVHVNGNGSGATPAPRPVSSPQLGTQRTEILGAGSGSQPDLSRPPVPRPAAGAASAAEAAVPGTATSDGTPQAEPSPDPAPRPAAPDPYVGTTFDGRYKIERLIGEGGMGFVYLARHKVIDKRVAVKVLRSDLARDREILDRFMQEARSASSIGNPHIVDISDFGDLPDGSTYFVMEYLEGQSLGGLIEARRDAQTPLDRICNIALQLCDGLAAAHAAGIVHRDLKPDNVFLIPRGPTQDFVKILDFGIAKVSKAGNTKLTRAGAVFGTPHYMSPEQAAGAPIDHRTDVYSLGVMLYELTARQLPFNADNFMGILTQHMYKAPVPIRALVPAPECPPGMEAIILKCLSKKPEMRYGSMSELADDLERARRGAVPGAVSEMMARSGGFNVPHDFFKPAQQAIVPATPAQSTRPSPGVWVAVGVAGVAVLAGLGFLGNRLFSTQPPVTTDTPETVAPVPVPAPTATAAPAPAKRTMVALAWTPNAAVGYRDGQALRSPVNIEVEEGKPATVEIKADGYEPVTVTLDGTEGAKQVDLVSHTRPGPRNPSAKTGPIKPPAGPAPKPGPAKPGPAKPGPAGEVVDPW